VVVIVMADAKKLGFVDAPTPVREFLPLRQLPSDAREHSSPATAINHDAKKSLSISALSRKCLASYAILGDGLRGVTVESAVEIGFDSHSSLSLVLDARTRFNAWAKSIGALQPEHLKSSLDSRLKDATDIRQSIIRVLADLQESLHTGECHPILAPPFFEIY
jgi:hypothetical protein